MSVELQNVQWKNQPSKCLSQSTATGHLTSVMVFEYNYIEFLWINWKNSAWKQKLSAKDQNVIGQFEFTFRANSFRTFAVLWGTCWTYRQNCGIEHCYAKIAEHGIQCSTYVVGSIKVTVGPNDQTGRSEDQAAQPGSWVLLILSIFSETLINCLKFMYPQRNNLKMDATYHW